MNEEEFHAPVSKGNIKTDVSLKGGRLFYAVIYRGDTIIRPSELGFEFNNQSALWNDLMLKSYSFKEFNDEWHPIWGQKNTIVNNYSELTVAVREKKEPRREFTIFFRVFDNGVAFRYYFPKQPHMHDVLISDEKTDFIFAEDAKTWSIPADYDSYEHLYRNLPLSQTVAVNTPVTLELKNGTCISLHEANLTDYAGMTLKVIPGKTGYTCDLVPWPDGPKVKTKVPFYSPWRTIQIADSAPGLIESADMILNLNEPNKIKDVSWIKPEKYMGIWWGMHLGIETWAMGDRHGATTKNTENYMDFASEHQIPAILTEGWNTGWENWGKKDAFDYITPYSDFNPEEIINYGKERNVSWIAHHETGGDAESYDKVLDTVFRQLQKWGVHALKTGYAGKIFPEGQHHHGQWMVNHYQHVVETAARYQIMVDAHEPIKPTGIERTWPNMMTREGVRGMEYNAWSDGNPAGHTCILPFTRCLAGPVDYTPGIFDIKLKNFAKQRKKWNTNDISETRIHTTIAHQLALYVVLYSPMQMAADLPDNYVGHPCFQFIRDVPVTWDETQVLNGKIGEYLTIARKSESDWFIGSITNESSRDLRIITNFLDSDATYKATIYADSKDTEWIDHPTEFEIGQKFILAGDTLNIHLAPGGGQAIRLVKAE